MSNESTSSNETDDLPAMHRHERGDNSIRGNSAPVANATIHDRTALYIAIIAMVLSALALGMVIMVPALQASRIEMLTDRTDKAEREARVMQERYNDLKVELAKRGIPVSDH
jgi:hypothetical protein